MANATTIVSTWTSQYFAETFLKPAISTEGLFDGAGYTIDPTVNKAKTIYEASEMKYITQKREACGFNASGTSALTEVKLETEPLRVNVEQCANVFFDTIFKSNLKKGTDVYDLSGTVIEELIVENMQRAIINDTFALAWFGDTSLASTAFLDQLQGWFARFEADAGVNKFSIGSTGDWALEALRAMDAGTNAPLYAEHPDTVILVTRNVYLELLRTYEALGTDVGLIRLNDGHDLMFRGRRVIAQPVWDKVISDQGLSNTKRIFMGPLSNLHVGTDILNPGSDAKLFFDELEEKFYFKANYDLGTQLLHSELVGYARG